MAVQLPGNPSQHGIERDADNMYIQDQLQTWACKWYFSREEIENQSPSRKDGIDHQMESQLRNLYCSFLHELGVEFKVPQLTIATAMMLCHRFYMRQSHAKNDWQTIATASMFLACKAEETPRWLNDVVVVAYKLLYKWDPSAPRRIRQSEIYEKQKELLLDGERILLSTVSFHLNIEHPYKPLVTALKRLEVSQKDLAKIAWNFVNDWLRTTLCLQHKPHYIAAGSLYLAAKLQKVKLSTEQGKVWWLQFDVSPKKLEEVIQQMRGLLEQNQKQARVPARGKSSSESTKPPPAAAVGNSAMTNSPQSCVLSGGSNTARESDLVTTAADAGRLVKCAISADVVSLKEPLKSDCGSSNSVVEDDGDGEEPRRGEFDDNSSKKKIVVSGGDCKIDVNRIREAIKRRRDKVVNNNNKKLVQTMAGDCEEAWVEQELENGIEPESAKKLRSF